MIIKLKEEESSEFQFTSSSIEKLTNIPMVFIEIQKSVRYTFRILCTISIPNGFSIISRNSSNLLLLLKKPHGRYKVLLGDINLTALSEKITDVPLYAR